MKYVFFFLLFISCTTHTPAHPIAKTKPYVIKGRKYYPQKHYEYKCIGKASWYGPGFHGKKNACGYKFNENFLCAAHRTLPLPSVVKVRNLKNNKTVKLLVVDRGPFAKDHSRIIDISKGAAKKIGLMGSGVTQVYVESLPKESLLIAQYIKQYRQYYGHKKLNIDEICKRHISKFY